MIVSSASSGMLRDSINAFKEAMYAVCVANDHYSHEQLRINRQMYHLQAKGDLSRAMYGRVFGTSSVHQPLARLIPLENCYVYKQNAELESALQRSPLGLLTPRVRPRGEELIAISAHIMERKFKGSLTFQYLSAGKLVKQREQQPELSGTRNSLRKCV